MLSDKACEELAEIVINFVEQAPDDLVKPKLKKQMGASHSIIIAGVRSGRVKWEEMLKRFHYWLHIQNIEISEPPENDKY